MTHIRQVLCSIQKVGLTVKMEKYEVGMAEVGYLGNRVKRGCIKPESAKVEVIKNCPTPQTQKSGTILYWDGQSQYNFCEQKEVICPNPVLVNSDFEKTFVIFTDASDTGLRAVLLQADGKGRGTLIVCMSKKLLPGGEKNYATMEKEYLVMVWVLSKL